MQVDTWPEDVAEERCAQEMENKVMELINKCLDKKVQEGERRCESGDFLGVKASILSRSWWRRVLLARATVPWASRSRLTRIELCQKAL